MNKKYCLIVVLSCLYQTALAHCPLANHIQKVPGTYAWEVKGQNAKDWVGFYAQPIRGKGHSTKVLHFREARWLQLNELTTSKGIVECDYQGNFKKEVIRFVLNKSHAIAQPKSDTWSHHLNSEFPSVAARCGASELLCHFTIQK